MRAEVVFGGDFPVAGPLLRLDEPLSFWGGVDPATGLLSDPRSPRHGRCVAGTVMVVPELRGSSSSSAVVLELLRRGLGPAALVLGAIDAIVGLGLLVGAEMGYATFPLLVLPARVQAGLGTAARVSIDAAGLLTVA